MASLPNRIVIKAEGDTYYDEEEPTIPSMRPQAIADAEKSSSMSPVQWLAFAGLIAAALVAIGGALDSTMLIGISGVVMIAGNIRAAVYK